MPAEPNAKASVTGKTIASSRLGDETMARLDTLAAITETPGSLTRRYLTSAHADAIRLVQAWMRDAGMHTRVDAVGNVIGRLEGRRPGAPTLLLGSHIDTVADAGRYDGTLGVVAAIVAVEELVRSGARLDHALEIVAFGDEEGVRFPTRLLTSRAITGAIGPEDFESSDANGTSVRDALRAFGGDADAYGSCARASHDIAAYLELHIEQGPVLQDKGLAVAAVTAINGATRMTASVTGTSGHAGTIPMALRRDAIAAAAEMILATEAVATAGRDVVATVGRIAAHPGAPNVVPGGADFTVDLRSPSDERRTRALEQLHAAFYEIAARRHVQVSTRTYYDMPATALDLRVIDAVSDAIEQCGQQPLRLSSGAGHDAMAMAERWPAGMIFVRCKDGVSHNPAESITAADADIAVRVLMRAVLLLDERMSATMK